MLSRIAAFVREQGAAPAIQLAHSGRKGSTRRPWEAPRGAVAESEGGWTALAPSAIQFAPDFPHPKELDAQEIRSLVDAFGAAARRSLQAGFRVVEIHSAHGYLLHEFLSPLSNHRADAYGGSFENRTRLLREVVGAVRAVWPERLPLFVRISSVDWAEGGWQIEDSIALAKQLAPLGVDLIDCSSGANLPTAMPPQGPGMQIPFAEAVRKGAGILTAAVGNITGGEQAEAIVREGKADLVLLARQMLRDPYWPKRVAAEARQAVAWPVQYLRAAPEGSAAQAPLD
jgi:2,4-dienoyl-CoA reductase-like NADH-dependent reductase (Old Yellow Enzyme family)